MTILTLPSIIRVNRCEFGLHSNTQVFRSPLSGAVQTLELPGAAWVAQLSLKDYLSGPARQVAAFLTRLRGQAGRFYLHDHSHPTPAGVATGVPVVSGADQVGTSLITTGWTPSVSGILLAGDWIQIGNELKLLVEDADSDISGDATLVFEPPLRSSPVAGATIITTKASCVMMLAESAWKGQTRPPIKTSFNITCVEDVTA